MVSSLKQTLDRLPNNTKSDIKIRIRFQSTPHVQKSSDDTDTSNCGKTYKYVRLKHLHTKTVENTINSFQQNKVLGVRPLQIAQEK